MPQTPQNTISQIAFKRYNQFRNVITEAIIWLKITINTGKKLEVETTLKEIYQQLLEFVIIYVLHIEQQHSSDQDIITLPMTPIINISFNKHPMPWELIHNLLLHTSGSVIKSMYYHQTLTGLPKHYPNKLNQAPCTILYTEKIRTFPKVTRVYTTNLKPG